MDVCGEYRPHPDDCQCSACLARREPTVEAVMENVRRLVRQERAEGWREGYEAAAKDNGIRRLYGGPF